MFINKDIEELPFPLEEEGELRPYFVTFEHCKNADFTEDEYVIVYGFSKEDAKEKYEQEHWKRPEAESFISEDEWSNKGKRLAEIIKLRTISIPEQDNAKGEERNED